jgi:SAM-dependent MidA family methyltransferase
MQAPMRLAAPVISATGMSCVLDKITINFLGFVDRIMNAKELICEHIRNQGNLLFVEFMQQALYTPNYGYYSSARQKFGVDGDFVTAPELTPLFGQTIAQQCAEWMSQIQQPHIFEFGAGSGALCVTMLTELAHRQQLPEAYHILEVSGHLRQQQLAHIEQHIPQWRDRIIWHESWPDQPFQGIVIANEVLDAMPVHRFLYTEQTILESYITLNEHGVYC